jgi:hypothetical protein
MNYGESLGYWYLRFNGFFPLTRFVLHKSSGIKHTSDCDLLAVRPPHVFEEVGGQPDDWDLALPSLFSDGVTVGLICEVKTGRYDPVKLFPTANVQYAVGRLGLIPRQHREAAAIELRQSAVIEPSPSLRIAQLLISPDGKGGANFIGISEKAVLEFIHSRISKYKDEKYRDRHFFDSDLLQHIIAEIKRVSM